MYFTCFIKCPHEVICLKYNVTLQDQILRSIFSTALLDYRDCYNDAHYKKSHSAGVLNCMSNVMQACIIIHANPVNFYVLLARWT